MQKNEGNLDRAVRVAAGLLLVGLAATATIGAWGYIGHRSDPLRGDRYVPAVFHAGHQHLPGEPALSQRSRRLSSAWVGRAGPAATVASGRFA